MTALDGLDVLDNVLVIKSLHQIDLVDDRLFAVGLQADQRYHFDSDKLPCLRVYAFVDATKGASAHDFLQELQREPDKVCY